MKHFVTFYVYNLSIKTKHSCCKDSVTLRIITIIVDNVFRVTEEFRQERLLWTKRIVKRTCFMYCKRTLTLSQIFKISMANNYVNFNRVTEIYLKSYMNYWNHRFTFYSWLISIEVIIYLNYETNLRWFTQNFLVIHTDKTNVSVNKMKHWLGN